MPGTLLVGSSAIDVGSTRRLPNSAAPAGFLLVDAPVPGWTGGATGSTLTSMIGGVEADVEAAGQDTQPMAGTIIATGGPTTGQAAQICSDVLALIPTTGLAQGVTRAGRLGLDHVFQDIPAASSGPTASSGGSCALDDRYPVPSGSENASSDDNDFATTFPLTWRWRTCRRRWPPTGPAPTWRSVAWPPRSTSPSAMPVPVP